MIKYKAVPKSELFGPRALKQDGLVQGCLTHNQQRFNAQLYDSVGRTLCQSDAAKKRAGPYDHHWHIAYPDPDDVLNWAAKIPFEFEGVMYEAWISTTHADEPCVEIYAHENVTAQQFDEAAWIFSLAFISKYWRMYANAILHPAAPAA